VKARAIAVAVAVLGTGCAQSVWTPGVALPWDAEAGVPEARVVDDCALAFDAVVLDLPSGALLDDDTELGALPATGPMQLVGANPRTLGEVRVDAAGVPDAVRYDVSGLDVAFTATCDDAASATVTVGPATITCPVPADLEVEPQASFGTWLEVDAAALFGEDPAAVAVAPWVDADDGDGALDEVEVGTLATPEVLLGRLAASSDAGDCAVTAP